MAWTNFRKPNRRWGPVGITAGALAGVVLAAAAAVSAMPASAAAGCQASYSIGSQWSGGFTASMSITNLGSPVTSWTVTWTFPGNQAINNLWAGGYTQSGASVTVTNASYDGTLAPGATATVGFTATGTSGSPSSVTCT